MFRSKRALAKSAVWQPAFATLASFWREGAAMIEPALAACHCSLDLPQVACAAQLGKQQRVPVLARGEAARSLVGPVLIDEPVEGGSGRQFQKIVKDAISVPHIFDFSCPGESPNSGPG